MTTFQRKLLNVKELKKKEKEKTEEAVRTEGTIRSLVEGPSIAMYKPIDTAGRYHSDL